MVNTCKTFRKWVLLLLAGGWCLAGYAQITQPGIPHSQRLGWGYDMRMVPVHELPYVDVAAWQAADYAEDKDVPVRFGADMHVRLNPKNSGRWTRLKNGDRIWRLRIQSPGALSLNFLFEHFRLPEGAELYLYTPQYASVLGALTAANNLPDARMATVPLRGDEVVLEYFLPARVTSHGNDFTISTVVHAYRDFFAIADAATRDFGDSGPCHNDINCPIGADWTTVGRSVSIIIVGGSRACTGAMVNNTANDGTPYFLTANHCGAGAAGTNLGNWVFVFNYQSPSCGGPDGSLSQSIAGGVVRARYAQSDVSLIQLSAPPPPSYGVYYAGWNNVNAVVDSSVCIHHPSGDVKKITFSYTPSISASWGGGPANTHWRVFWGSGATEPGSSGSPLFDMNKRIIGQLHGGPSSCSASPSNMNDLYGKFSLSWTGGGTNTSRLSNWLDPAGTGATVLDGFLYGGPTTAWDISAQVSAPVDQYCDGNGIVPVVEVENLGSGIVNYFTVSYSLDGGAPQSFVWTGTPIPAFGTTTLSMPALNGLGAGVHTYTVEVSMPNDSTDANPTNNVSTSTFEILSNGVTITLNLLTDNYPQETSYQIVNAATGAVVASGGGFSQAATSYTRSHCVAPGCYQLQVLDSYGDGICCFYGNGSFSWQVDGTSVHLGGQFTSVNSFSVCVPVANITPVADFSLPAQACPGEPVFPIDASQNAVSYAWTATGAIIEGGNTPTPTLVFPNPGTYTVTLTITNATGQTDTHTESITINNNVLILLQAFTDGAIGENWIQILDSNGNVVAQVDTLPGPFQVSEYLFCIPPGCYDFILHDRGGDGMEAGGALWSANGYEFHLALGNSFTTQNSHNQCVPLVVEASFILNKYACVGEEVSPANTSTAAAQFEWDMVGANPASSTLPNPTFTYSSPGQYEVNLMAFGFGGPSTAHDTITVLDEGAIVTLELLTDNYPDETSYAIYDAATGELVVFGGNFSDKGANYTRTHCLPYGCYRFEMYDSYGDGICCDYGLGNYSWIADGSEFFVSAGSFGSIETTNYCIAPAVSVPQVAPRAFSLQPNPTTGYTEVFTGQQKAEIIELLDLNGRILHRVAPNSHRQQLDTHALPAGVYLVRCTFGQQVNTQRLIKQ